MISIKPWNDFPNINHKCDLVKLIIKNCKKELDNLRDGDILCIASKLVSKSRGLFIDLDKIKPSENALRVHHEIPSKDPRMIQLIINQTADLSGKKLQVENNFIGGWLPNGLFLTGAGVDKFDKNTAIILPKICDDIAKQISISIYQEIKKELPY